MYEIDLTAERKSVEVNVSTSLDTFEVSATGDVAGGGYERKINGVEVIGDNDGAHFGVLDTAAKITNGEIRDMMIQKGLIK